MTKKIAILGGSFDPIHFGHLLAAQQVIESNKVEEVWLMPCWKHAFNSKKISSSKDRKKMISIALKELKNKKIKLSDFEINLGKKTKEKNYTFNTIKALKEKYSKKEFYWIIGSKTVPELKQWKNIKELIKLVKFIVIPIPGDEIKQFKKNPLLKKNKSIILNKAVALNFSSTQARKKIKQNKNELLIPKKVLFYAKKHKLYT